ncbi:MAG TPA: lactonase family protein [Chitinophagaceae bacterium]|nr:lactonase family protein [Chitinophagaceae bacterium]
MIRSILILLVLNLNLNLNLISQQSKEKYLIIGTYTSPAKDDGIYVYKFNTETGDNSFVSSVKTSNPSYLVVSPNNKYVYAVNEDAPGMVTSFIFNKPNNRLLQKNRQPSQGKHPCYITIDKTGKWVIVGNYSSGTVAVYPVNKDGSLGAPTDSVKHEGSSVNLARQETAHVHATVLNKNNKTLYVPDLGLDKVMLYSLDTKKGKLKEFNPPFIITEAGAGPRHVDIHPNGKYAYLMEELTGSISVYKIESNGFLSLLQNISGLPRDFTGDIGSADIHVSPDGKFLYCSNRGESNTIGILSIDQSTGELKWVDHQATLGRTPRNFNFDPSGNFLLVANQNSDEIVIFKRNKQTGLLADTGKRINVSKPVCLKWMNVE